ncbi:MAG: response regulator transcription factor [Raoultibacter sp.]
MEEKYEILVVEDDAAVRNLVATTLEVHGYRHREVSTGNQALLEFTSSHDIDLAILDLGLPDMDGVDIIRTVRGWSHMPIIVLSARLEDADKVEALDAGADDYLVKPFSVDELLARLRVALRRIDAVSVSEDETVFDNGDLHIDFSAVSVTCRGEEIHLTPIEYKLLCLLARNMGKVLTHNFILKEVWGQALTSDLPSLRVFMATLRKKIEADPSHPQYIQTHVGIGYRMLRVEG